MFFLAPLTRGGRGGCFSRREGRQGRRHKRTSSRVGPKGRIEGAPFDTPPSAATQGEEGGGDGGTCPELVEGPLLRVRVSGNGGACPKRSRGGGCRIDCRAGKSPARRADLLDQLRAHVLAANHPLHDDEQVAGLPFPQLADGGDLDGVKAIRATLFLRVPIRGTVCGSLPAIGSSVLQ